MSRPTSQGEAPTGSASRYITQLCKHWGHKFEVRFDPQSGEIALPSGPCRLRAEPDVLKVEIEAADEATLARMEEVVAAHLERFAFREPFKLTWSRPTPAEPPPG